jgi:hypothetical protein
VVPCTTTNARSSPVPWPSPTTPRPCSCSPTAGGARRHPGGIRPPVRRRIATADADVHVRRQGGLGSERVGVLPVACGLAGRRLPVRPPAQPGNGVRSRGLHGRPAATATSTPAGGSAEGGTYVEWDSPDTGSTGPSSAYPPAAFSLTPPAAARYPPAASRDSCHTTSGARP